MNKIPNNKTEIYRKIKESFNKQVPKKIKNNQMMSKVVYKYYEKNFFDILSRFLRQTGSLLAGGSILAALHDYKINDLDIYVQCKNAIQLINFLIANFDLDAKIKLGFSYEYSGLNKNKILYRIVFYNSKYKKGIFDIIILHDDVKPIDVVTNVDLSFCEVWYDGKNFDATDMEGVINKKGYIKENYKKLVLDNFDESIINRIKKYAKHGFTINYSCEYDVSIKPFQICNSLKTTPEEWVVKNLYNLMYRFVGGPQESIEWVCNNPLTEISMAKLNNIALKTMKENHKLNNISLKDYYSGLFRIFEDSIDYKKIMKFDYIKEILGITFKDFSDKENSVKNKILQEDDKIVSKNAKKKRETIFRNKILLLQLDAFFMDLNIETINIFSIINTIEKEINNETGIDDDELNNFYYLYELFKKFDENVLLSFNNYILLLSPKERFDIIENLVEVYKNMNHDIGSKDIDLLLLNKIKEKAINGLFPIFNNFNKTTKIKVLNSLFLNKAIDLMNRPFWKKENTYIGENPKVTKKIKDFVRNNINIDDSNELLFILKSFFSIEYVLPKFIKTLNKIKNITINKRLNLSDNDKNLVSIFGLTENIESLESYLKETFKQPEELYNVIENISKIHSGIITMYEYAWLLRIDEEDVETEIIFFIRKLITDINSFVTDRSELRGIHTIIQRIKEELRL